ncbi:VC0807 family protein [Streptomyces roseicoloratus]|uniref:VC0807 family protein n=1 Tax=Streptomyces roseicoloratus TaxID=2508722 RepID=A0ABY9S2Z2_9ACTN|nr:VC0807 family protein [Streptomyces roseicoloratus]WMX48226.1 VC0807 family protein [Streptomyces roseicoloratus]
MSATAAQPSPPARSGAATAIGWALTVSFTIVAPILTYGALTDRGWSEFGALLVSGAWPVLDTVIHLIWHRKVDELAIVTLFFLVLTAVVSLVGDHSARTLLVKDSAVTGLFGVLCMVTLFAPRPLMFYFSRRFATDGTPESHAWWNGLWQIEGFRAVMRRMTIVWGVAYLAEAVTRIVLSYALSVDAMVVVNPILIYGTLGLLILWTVRTGKRSRAEGEARAAEAAAAAAGS